MKELINILTLKEDKISLKILFLLIAISFAFSIGIRMIWVYQVSGNGDFVWNNEIMINTNDGYMFAEGARDIIAGFHQKLDSSRVGDSASMLTAFLYKILPIKFETLILYMPAVLGSLIVVPIILIGRALNFTMLGFFASLLGGIAWSYYHRTMVGYYDSDMLIIVLPLFILWSLILSVTHNKDKYLVFSTITTILYNLWYPGSYSLNIALLGMLIAYILIFDRKNEFNYKIVIFMGIAIAKISLPIQALLAITLYLFFNFYKNADKFIYYILGVVFLLVAFTGGIEPITKNLTYYIFRPETVSNTGESFKFFSVVQTVREAGSIPFETFANRISGHQVTFFLSTVGYILMAFRYRIMLLLLPMLGLGFLAYSGGLRFTIYAVPVNALGVAYLVFLATNSINKNFVKYGVISFLFALMIYPNIKHIMGYTVPTVFNKEEVKILDKLKSIADREDYVLSWWDYGYPIRYYADVKTFIDGGKHVGRDNYPVSFSLVYPQVESANMARLIAEYDENTGKKDSFLQQTLKEYNFKNIETFLQTIKSKKFKPHKKTVDIYYYLPLRMTQIYATVALFSYIDLHTGKRNFQPFFYQTTSFKDIGNKILLSNGIEINKINSTLKVGTQNIPISKFIITSYGFGNRLNKDVRELNPFGGVVVVYMKSYHRFMVMDTRTFNSTYIQLFVLENYDREFFEPVILNPLVKVYKLKI